MKIQHRVKHARIRVFSDPYFPHCSKLTIKTPEQRQVRRSGFFIVNFEHASKYRSGKPFFWHNLRNSVSSD